jgi:hypothetical protein
MILMKGPDRPGTPPGNEEPELIIRRRVRLEPDDSKRKGVELLPDEPGKKRLELLPDQEAQAPDKRLTLLPEESPRRRLELLGDEAGDKGATASRQETAPGWFQQKNANDCGPCLLLNFLAVRGLASPGSIAEMRAEVNRKIREGNQRTAELNQRTERTAALRAELGPSAWLSTEDINNYLHALGYRLRPWGFRIGNRADQEEARAEILQAIRRDFDLLYATAGAHFTGVTPVAGQAGRYLLLDSFNRGPVAIDERGLRDFIERGLSSGGRSEVGNFARLGMAYRETR